MTDPYALIDPVINTIAEDTVAPGSSGHQLPLGLVDQAEIAARAMDAVAARRRREFEAAREALRGKVRRDNEDAAQLSGRRPDNDAETGDPSRAPVSQLPERVRKRYLRTGNQYFLKDAPYQLAFEDLGPYLITEHNRPDVVESMVDMAVAKSWRRIRVTGHEEFRREAWLRATLLGIDVKGYEPRPADLARLADARQANLSNRIEVEAPVPASTGSTSVNAGGTPSPNPSQAVAYAERAGAAKFTSRSEVVTRSSGSEALRSNDNGSDAPRRYVGELREHSRAPYQYNPARGESYYVVYRDAAGADQVVWGVDLERAVLDAKAEIGQRVVLENLGRRLVTIKVPILDAQGVVLGEEEKDVHRNTWQVEIVGRERTAAEPVASVKNLSPDIRDLAGNQIQERAVAKFRSTMSNEDRAVHLAVLVAAMRKQRYSERSIQLVQQRAEQMLDAFGKEGIPVPKPRIFDPKVPSMRDRRSRGVSGRAPAREIERTPIEQAPSR